MLTVAYAKEGTKLYLYADMSEELTIIPKGSQVSVLRESDTWIKVISTVYGGGYVQKDSLVYKDKNSYVETAENVIRCLQERSGFDGFWDRIDGDLQQDIIDELVMTLKGI